MGFLKPVYLETIGYGVEGWNGILRDNFYRLNTIFGKFVGAWNNPPVGGLLRFNGDSWEADTTHPEDQTAHGLGGRTEDITFSDPNKGVVLVDRATGDKYRVYVEGGVIKLELVE